MFLGPQAELYTVLYPVFVHLYLDLVTRGFSQEARVFAAKHGVDHPLHKREIELLKGVATQEQIAECQFTMSFRSGVQT